MFGRPAKQEQKEEDNEGVERNLHTRHLSPVCHVDDARVQSIHLRGISLVERASQQKGSISDRFPDDVGAQVGKTPQQKEIRSRESSNDRMHPTDQVVRQKGDRKYWEAKPVEDGMSPEETQKGRRRKQIH